METVEIVSENWEVTYFNRENEATIFDAKIQALVVQRLDNAIHRINRYPVDKC